MSLDCQFENYCNEWHAALLPKNATNRQQKWLREKDDYNYFTLKNVFNGKFLTAKSRFKTKIEGKKKSSLLIHRLGG